MADRHEMEPRDRGDDESDFESLMNLEERFERKQVSEGFETGYELGLKSGQEDGYSQGLIEGAKRGREVGFYKGFTMTWIDLLKQRIEDNDNEQQRKRIDRLLTKLNEVHQLVDTFPRKNETHCLDKLSIIRVKFKQATSLLQVKVDNINW